MGAAALLGGWAAAAPPPHVAAVGAASYEHNSGLGLPTPCAASHLIVTSCFTALLHPTPGPCAGAAYYELISGLGLPTQLAEVDPMIASHCGGIVGVLTAALSDELNNAKTQVGGWRAKGGWASGRVCGWRAVQWVVGQVGGCGWRGVVEGG